MLNVDVIRRKVLNISEFIKSVFSYFVINMFFSNLYLQEGYANDVEVFQLYVNVPHDLTCGWFFILQQCIE